MLQHCTLPLYIRVTWICSSAHDFYFMNAVFLLAKVYECPPLHFTILLWLWTPTFCNESNLANNISGVFCWFCFPTQRFDGPSCVTLTSLHLLLTKNNFGQVINKISKYKGITVKEKWLSFNFFLFTHTHLRSVSNKQNNTNGTNNQSSVEHVSFDSRLLLLGWACVCCAVLTVWVLTIHSQMRGSMSVHRASQRADETQCRTR